MELENAMTIEVIGAGFGHRDPIAKIHAGDARFRQVLPYDGIMTNEGHVAQWRQASRGEKVEWHDLYRYLPPWIGPVQVLAGTKICLSRRQSNSHLARFGAVVHQREHHLEAFI